ncbi:MAG: SDR family oxidoreductase [Rhizobiaceae bacterium]|nr:SDR family oxidoreductase [Rhizobiaceae bacterium]
MVLVGKNALVTGGSSGIGLAAARLLADNGARVAITGRSPAKLASVVAELSENVTGIQTDVTSLTDLAKMRATIEQAFGSLDIVFANAGVAFGTPLATTEEATYHRIIDANVKGVFFTVQAVLPLLRDGASIILNTSWLNQVGTPGRAILSASKAAVRSFARTMSAELLDRRIRVNAVSPGSIQTPIHRGNNETEEEFRAYAERIGTRVPLGRMGKPEEIAAAVLFLASDASSYMLGAEMVIDGGRSEL